MIYFILDATNDAVKIGRSNNPAKRLKSLQTASPFELVMLGTIPGSSSEENQLHDRFDEYRIRRKGEWFRLEPELMDAVESLLATGSLHRNVWQECLARERCRSGLSGLAMLHAPTGHHFDCHGSMWGADGELILFPRGTDPDPASLFVRASDIHPSRLVPPAKYRAEDCVLESEWRITCCRPVKRSA